MKNKHFSELAPIQDPHAGTKKESMDHLLSAEHDILEAADVVHEEYRIETSAGGGKDKESDEYDCDNKVALFMSHMQLNSEKSTDQVNSVANIKLSQCGMSPMRNKHLLDDKSNKKE